MVLLGVTHTLCLSPNLLRSPASDPSFPLAPCEWLATRIGCWDGRGGFNKPPAGFHLDLTPGQLLGLGFWISFGLCLKLPRLGLGFCLARFAALGINSGGLPKHIYTSTCIGITWKLLALLFQTFWFIGYGVGA